MFVLEHKVEESKIIDTINADVKFTTRYLPLPTKPSLNPITTIHVERTSKENLDNLTLKGLFQTTD